MSARPAGRPSVVGERRAAILDAYIHLMAHAATVRVPVQAVADRAGVARPAVAHFVGDRGQLHIEAARELEHRYERVIRSAIGADPTPEGLVDFLFSDGWARERSVEDQAFDAFTASALSEPAVAEPVRHMYDLLIDELARAILRTDPTIGAEHADAIAYTIVCLAEMNATMIQLDAPHSRSAAAGAAARHLLATWEVGVGGGSRLSPATDRG